MNTNINTAAYTMPQVEAQQRSFVTRVYGWMALALTVTALVAMTIASYSNLIDFIMQNRILFFGLVIAQLVLVGWLVIRVQKMSVALATFVFFAYAALTGVTFSMLFALYTSESIASTFFITGGTFGAMSAYGYFTKRDLTSFGNLLFMGLIGVILASVVNIFLHSPAVYWAVTIIGILVFVGLIAYDTQLIKKMSLAGNTDSDAGRKEAIIGALRLYLDFINLFILLLRLFGQRR